MDKLYMISGPLLGATAELIGEEITIGRAPDNAICIDDESVSDHHAVITRQNRECVVRDLGSAKGTYVRGEKVIITALQDSDRVVFGSVEAEFGTTEVKLHIPTTPLRPAAPQTIAWPQRKISGGAQAGSSFKSAARKLVTFVALVMLAGGGYVVYQKFSSMEPTADAPTPETAKVAPLAAAPSAPAQAPAASLPPTPQPYVATASAAPQPVAAVEPTRSEPSTVIGVVEISSKIEQGLRTAEDRSSTQAVKLSALLYRNLPP